MDAGNLTWEEILARLKANRHDEQAWAAFYDQGWPLVVATIARQLRFADTRVEDIAQESFVRMLRYCRFDEFKDANALRAYLAETARNTAKNFRKATVRDPLRAATTLGSESDVHSQVPNVELVAMAREYLEKGILAGLGDVDRRIVEGLLEGRTLQELAESTNLTYGAVATRIHRLRRRRL